MAASVVWRRKNQRSRRIPDDVLGRWPRATDRQFHIFESGLPTPCTESRRRDTVRPDRPAKRRSGAADRTAHATHTGPETESERGGLRLQHRNTLRSEFHAFGAAKGRVKSRRRCSLYRHPRLEAQRKL